MPGEPAFDQPDPGTGSGPAPVPGSGGRRSEPTRRAILEAARATFAERGYERTTIRVVAALAGVDASMVMRYFGSKAGLFAAVSTADLHVPDLRGVDPGRRGEAMVRHFLERWECGSPDDSLVFLLRTAVTNEAVAEQLQSHFDALITEPIAELGASQPEQRSALIGAELLGIALCRYLLRLQPIAGLSTESLIAGVAPTIQAHLDAPLG